MEQPPVTDDPLAPLRQLPPLPLATAAWLAGLTPETLERHIKIGLLKAIRQDGQTLLTAEDMIRAAFQLAGQKESQVTMLRLQLASALRREKELAAVLEEKVEFERFVAEEEPVQTTVTPTSQPRPATTISAPAAAPAIADTGKKNKKKK